MCIHIYIYIHIEIEREREVERLCRSYKNRGFGCLGLKGGIHVVVLFSRVLHLDFHKVFTRTPLHFVRFFGGSVLPIGSGCLSFCSWLLVKQVLLKAVAERGLATGSRPTQGI